MAEKLSQSLQEKFNRLEEKTGAIAAGALLGAGIGGAMKLAGKGGGVAKGFTKGVYAGIVVELLLLGGYGVAQLVKKAREKGAAETKASIRKAVARAQESDKLTSTQKATIKNSGAQAIAKIDQANRKAVKHESFYYEELEGEAAAGDSAAAEGSSEGATEEASDGKTYESLGNKILGKLDALREAKDKNTKKVVAAGALGGAVVGHQVAKATAKKRVKSAVSGVQNAKSKVKAAAAETKSAIKGAGAARTMHSAESRKLAQMNKKNPSGLVDKLKNHTAKLTQKGRVKEATKTLKGHPEVAKKLAAQKAAQNTLAKNKAGLAAAKKGLRKVGKFGGAGKGALIGGALAAGAYGIHKAINKNK